MTSDASSLSVFVCGTRCGELRENKHGSLSFEYDPDYAGIPLSMSMPVGLARYDDRVVRPYLMGLLPDDEGTRRAIGAMLGVSGDNPFRLLRVLGLDCPGAVQVCPDGTSPATEDPKKDLEELSEEEISDRLTAVKEDAASAWRGVSLAEGHWSLGGCQAKIALRRRSGRWFECSGAAATTHILKPGVSGFDNQALVEYLSMRAALAVGLPAAEVEYRMFGMEPAVVVTRYDRVQGKGGSVLRVHQEDLCQALSVSPSTKYAEQGGPTTPRIMALLKKTGQNARENVYRFALYLFFNYLIGATDAHAKNHSLLIAGKDDMRLAPLYDVASMAPYRSLAPTQRKPLRAALSIGGENRFGMVGAAHVENMVRTCGLEDVGLDADTLNDRFRKMAALVPGAVAEAIDDVRKDGIADVDEIGDALYREIAANCRRTAERL